MLGIFFVDKVSGEILQCIAMAFVDDTDLMTEVSNAFQLMQQILDMYNRLYGAIGGYVQEDKTTYFAWKWCWK